jgi:hypothetical protein
MMWMVMMCSYAVMMCMMCSYCTREAKALPSEQSVLGCISLATAANTV